jgi:hypothetical protein
MSSFLLRAELKRAAANSGPGIEAGARGTQAAAPAQAGACCTAPFRNYSRARLAGRASREHNKTDDSRPRPRRPRP